MVALAILFASVALLERVPRLQFVPSPFRRPFLATDVAWYGVATSASLVFLKVFRPQLERLSVVPVVGRLPGPVRFVVALAAYDLVAFVVHVGVHRSSVLWEVHKVHHSSLRLDWLATTRTHLVEHMLRNLPAQAVLFALGVPAGQVTAVAVVYAGFALLNHSNLGVDLHVLEPVFVTPRLHRRHHVPSTSQRNFGTVFTVWDRAFRTLVVLDTAPDEEFGVPGEREAYPQRFADAFRQPARRLLAPRPSA